MADRRAKIRFYAALKRRVSDPAWPAGKIPIEWLLNGAPKSFDPASGTLKDADAPGLAHVTFGVDGTAYMTDPDAASDDPDPDVYFAQTAERTDAYLHLRVWRLRRSLLPSLHDRADGTTTPIDLTETQGISEALDIIFFLESGIVGWLINRAGPSQNDVLRYLSDRTAVNMRLAILHREDALDLVQGHLVNAVDVEVAAGHFGALATVTEEIGNAAKAVNTPGLRTIRVSFSAEREQRSSFWEWWRSRARQLVALGSGEVRRLDVIQGGTEDTPAQIVDLLSQVIGLEATVELGTGRTVEVNDARRALLDGYNSNVELITRAVDILDSVGENQRVDRKKPMSRPSQGMDTVMG